MSKVYIKTKIYSGHGSLSNLEIFKGKKILIVCDRFMAECGSLELLLKELDGSNEIRIFAGVVPDPTTEVVGNGLNAAAGLKPDVVIGFGGGSAIDTAKGIIYFAIQQNMFSKPEFVAVPTTSGTGSEVTSATVITDRELKSKHLISDDEILADMAILDSRLTLSVPPAVTANTGMDVMTHALEACVATGGNVFSDALSEKAVELLLSSLLSCYCNGSDVKARTSMHEASTLAGMAFNTAGLGANHAIAHQLGGTFHIPHGLANAILLCEIIRFNCRDRNVMEKYTALTCKVNLSEMNDPPEYSIRILCAAINMLMKTMKMPQTLREAGVTKEAFEAQLDNMTRNAMKDTCMSSAPVLLSEDDIREILRNIF